MEKGALIGQGRTADVFAWGSDRVLKLYQTWMAAPPIEREFAITRAAGAAGLPVPAADELVETEGRIGIVFERVEGPSMLRILERQPWKVVSIARQLAELHAHMHTCSLPPGTYTQREQIERGLERGEALSPEEKESVHTALLKLPEGGSVCHGDFHPDNVLITSHGPIIIDWLTGARGHPLGDVCRTLLLLRTGGLPPRVSPFVGAAINVSRVLITSIYLRHYLHLHGGIRRQVEAWNLPLLAARLVEVEDYPKEKTMILNQVRILLQKKD